MNPISILFASVAVSLSATSDFEQNGPLDEVRPSELMLPSEDLTLMTGYERFLDDPQWQVDISRDA